MWGGWGGLPYYCGETGMTQLDLEDVRLSVWRALKEALSP